jgi:hypothetical protein
MLLFVALLLAGSSPVAQTPVPATQSATLQQLVPAKQSVDCKGKTFASAEEALQSGCCSWHGGVCGCSNGRKRCCDGELSPSCKC